MYYWHNSSGITPAYAGKTGCVATLLVRWEDHPRLRGENTFICPSLILITGSPPPTRGKLNIFTPIRIIFRITPAYAGKTYAGSRHKSTVEDHPRLRGEN